MKVIGYSKTNMKNENGEPFSFYTFYYTNEAKDFINDKKEVKATGCTCGYVMCSGAKINGDIKIGDEIDVFYNSYGKVAEIRKK